MYSWLKPMDLHDWDRKYSALKLAFCWIAGLFLGWNLYEVSGIRFGCLIRESVLSPVSVGEAVVRVLAPFLICRIGVYLEQRWLIYSCGFLKACLMVFVSLTAMASFGAGGWLMRSLFLFSDTVLCVLWYGFCLHCLSETGGSPEKTLMFCSVGLLVAGMDLRVVMPLLERVIRC